SLEAAAVNIGTTTRDAAAFDPRAFATPARILTTIDPHVFRFVIQGLQPLTLYQLSMFFPPSPICGTLFWRNSTQGFAVSGGDPVLSAGVAATTQLEVQDPAPNDWVGANPLDFTDVTAASRRFRWRSSVANVIGGELQISTSIFPNRGDFGACDEPDDGVVYRQNVSVVAAEWADIEPIDFHAIV